MKTLFTMMCLLLWGCISSAQNIEYGYDAGGNRISKKPSDALPVTLVSFTAGKSGKSVVGSTEDVMALLSWQTSAEINADVFSIQRSQDGKNWFDIGSVEAKRELTPGEFSEEDKISNTYYSFVDKTPLEGENLYRLKMIDQDKSFAYSQIRNLHFEPDVLVYPNPVSSQITLKWSALRTVQIFNNSGKMVLEISNNTSKIDVSTLSAGVYILKLTDNNGSSVMRKIVKE